MRLTSLVGILLLLGFCASAVMAAPGGGNGEKPWSYPIVVSAIVGEQEPLNNDCPGQEINCGDVVTPASFAPATDDDWFNFEVTTPGLLLTVGTQPYNGSDTDTYLKLWYEYNCNPTTLPLAEDDDSGPGMFSLIAINPAPTGRYYAQCFSYGHLTTGEYEFFVNCTAHQPPPPNDQCSGALVLPCWIGSVDGDLTEATNDYDPGIPGPSCTGYGAAGRDLTYKVDLDAGNIIHLVYTGYNYDASFYIVTDCGNASGSCVVGADGMLTGQPETIDWTCTTTGTYYIIVDAYGTDAGGTYTMSYTIRRPDRTVDAIGPGVGTVLPCTGTFPPGSVVMNFDEVSDGIAWQYGGVEPPYYGAMANYFPGVNRVSGIRLYMTRNGAMAYTALPLDIYVWATDASGCPTAVMGVTSGVTFAMPAAWPEVSCVDVAINQVSVNGRCAVGYWPPWPGGAAQWYIAADDCDSGTGLTNVAPGIGYPSGWQGVSVMPWCVPTGTGTPCGGRDGCIGIGMWTPDSSGVAVETSSWGSIKNLFRNPTK
jgi:hypothetical protein